MIAKTKLWYLENFNLFDCLSMEKMKELSQKLKMQNVIKNEIIYFADEPSKSIYLLKVINDLTTLN